MSSGSSSRTVPRVFRLGPVLGSGFGLAAGRFFWEGFLQVHRIDICRALAASEAWPGGYIPASGGPRHANQGRCSHSVLGIGPRPDPNNIPPPLGSGSSGARRRRNFARAGHHRHTVAAARRHSAQVRGSTSLLLASSQLAARSSQDGHHRCEGRLFCDFAACSLQLAARRIDTTRKSPGQRNLTFCEQLSVLCTTTSAHGPNVQAAKGKVQGASCSTTNPLNSHLPLARFRFAAKRCLY